MILSVTPAKYRNFPAFKMLRRDTLGVHCALQYRMPDVQSPIMK